MHNTNNHAVPTKKGVKHWWLCVNHDKINNKVSFIFVDYGIGIFESLKYKPYDSKWHGVLEKIVALFKYGGNAYILKKLLDGVIHMTVTGQHFRGKGLPGIKQVMERNQISNLHLISNNVYADVSKNIYKKLTNSFSGTLAYWELNQNNVNSEWIL